MVGCGVSFHPGRDAKAPYEIMRLYLEAGGKANKCVMSHLERKFIIYINSFLGAKCSIYLVSCILRYTFGYKFSLGFLKIWFFPSIRSIWY